MGASNLPANKEIAHPTTLSPSSRTDDKDVSTLRSASMKMICPREKRMTTKRLCCVMLMWKK